MTRPLAPQVARMEAAMPGIVPRESHVVARATKLRSHRLVAQCASNTQPPIGCALARARPKPMKARLFVLLLLPLIVGVAVFVVLNSRRAASPSGYVHSNPGFSNVWKENAFMAIGDGPEFESALNRIKWITTNSPAADQKHALLQLVRDFILIHSSTNYDVFERFSFPVRKGEFLAGRLAIFRKDLQKAGVNPPESPTELLRAYWEKVEVPQRAESNAVWRGIAMSKASITLATMTRIPASLQDYALQRENIHAFGCKPIFTALPRPNEVLKEHGTLIVATFGAIIERSSGKVGPYYLRAYWEPVQKVWIHWEFVEAGETDYFYLF